MTKKNKETNACGCPPAEDGEIPVQMRNPYGSTFMNRVLMSYQVLPSAHPYGNLEKMNTFTPEALRVLEDATFLTREQKAAIVQRRDKKWDRGIN